MFTILERDRIRDRVLEMARSDRRIVAGAFVGGTADGGDRWSDLDITFGVSEKANLQEVLEDWTRRLANEFNALHLFDLSASSTIYRVFLTPSNLQVDLSFAPEKEFEQRGPRFKLLFGKAMEKYQSLNPTPEHIFGLAAHHLVRARLSIERGRLWQAEYWIEAARDEVLTLMCLEHGLRLREGRGYDDLPSELLMPFKKTLVEILDREHLMKALRSTVECFLENSRSQERSLRLGPQMQMLGSSDL